MAILSSFGAGGRGGLTVTPEAPGQSYTAAASRYATKQQAATAREQLAFDRETRNLQLQRFNQILGMYQDAFGSLDENGQPEVSGDFDANVELFQPGGLANSQANLAIERGGQQAIAAGQIGLAKTGMGSGTNAAGLTARVASDTAIAQQEAQSAILDRLSGALTARGEARLSAAEIATRAQTAFMSSLASLA